MRDPGGRAWVVATIDMLYGLDPADPAFVEDTARLSGHYETQVFHAAPGGGRGLSSGHGWRYRALEEATTGHSAVCRAVEEGELDPQPPAAE